MIKFLSAILLSAVSFSAMAQVPAMIDNKAFMFNKDRGSFNVVDPTGRTIGKWSNGQGMGADGVQYRVQGNQVITSKGDVFIIINDNIVVDKTGKQTILNKSF